MAHGKIFGSDITRTLNKLNNNLYDLIAVNPVTPLPANRNRHLSCDFVPKTDKYFVPKKKLRPKVRTVRDIRNLFEKDICSTLAVDLDKQQNLLFRKIRGGSAKDVKTKSLAKNMLKSEKPISRIAWQMVININSEDHPHPSQFVLWNGKCIKVLGSRGAKSKFICKYDLAERRASLLQKHELKKKQKSTKNFVLRDSLDVKFKPGPLSKKKYLDISYQKYSIGNIELAHLPKPGLDILPEYGKPLESSVTNFLNNLRDVNGIISEKWAEFAVSTLGKEENGHAVQLHKDCCVTFDLNYKYAQRRLLMRRDIESLNWRQIESQTTLHKETYRANTQDIKNMLDEMLTSVEINLMQNDMYTGEDSPREMRKDNAIDNFNSQDRDKVKRRGELNRLDVTVIRLSDTAEKNKMDVCPKSFCNLGCVCDSIHSSFILKNHCGNVECMFECKCNFTKYYNRNSFEDDTISGLINLDKGNNLKLAKEEQKFHQTVILSGEKSILLKSHKRTWKAPKKYADFYSNMSLKTKKNIDRILSVVDIKLNCGNIEPWCMVHNLYKCFCKGKFTERLLTKILNEDTQINDTSITSNKTSQHVNLEENLNIKSNESNIKNTLRPRTRIDLTTLTLFKNIESIDMLPEDCSYQECARTKAYINRKYDDIYYFNANKRIMELEQNDKGLRKRMMEILNIDETSEIKKPKYDSSNPLTIDLSSSPVPAQINEVLTEKNEAQKSISIHSSSNDKLSSDFITTQFTSPAERHLNLKLKAWLEPSLKVYRERFSKGFCKKSLDPPRTGKIALYPWEFIMNRYKERKNLFLVTNKKPFRIFMAVDDRNSLFKNCTNITNIIDLDAYPVSVKNIVTNKTDLLKDQLCILRGLHICWELVGSIKKVCDRRSSESEEYVSESSSDKEGFSISNNNNNSKILTSDPVTDSLLKAPIESNLEQSKWFFMTIENDFSEIQFYKRGFFVKYESIIKAINVARISEKTVRLSSQKHIEGNTDPQFGIYAIPNANQYCVFIGPYEIGESLGIETIKSTLYGGKNKTRGVWITTNKVDNLQVIDNPLSFMSRVNSGQEQILDDSVQNEANKNSLHDVEYNSDNMSKVGTQEKKNNVVKLVKPIKITKTNNFYHLTSGGLLRQIATSPEKQNLLSTKPFLLNKRLSFDFDTNSTSLQLPQESIQITNCTPTEKKQVHPKRPVAEIAPQVKFSDECADMARQKLSQKNIDRGMFVLKPEEINNRALVSKINFTPQPANINHNAVTLNTVDSEIDMDIENFLANSVECSAPNTDIYVISDDENNCNVESNSNKKYWKEVWIVCSNILNVGWIAGRQDANKRLSFEFPGFQFTEFYAKEEAFEKINQVLARKIYVPEQLNLIWNVMERKEDMEKLNIEKLKQDDLHPDYVLTEDGFLHKFNLNQLFNKKIYIKDDSARKSQLLKIKDTKMDLRKINSELERACDILDTQGELLWKNTKHKKSAIAGSLSKMTNDRRQEISERLRSIITNENIS